MTNRNLQRSASFGNEPKNMESIHNWAKLYMNMRDDKLRTNHRAYQPLGGYDPANNKVLRNLDTTKKLEKLAEQVMRMNNNARKMQRTNNDSHIAKALQNNNNKKKNTKK